MGAWKQCNHVKRVFGNSYSGLVTISPVKDLLFLSKCTTFSSNRTERGATISRKEPADVQVMLWELEEHALISWGSVIWSWGASAFFGTDWISAAQMHGCGVATAFSGSDSTNKQSVSQERQRCLRDSLANLSLTSLEREKGSKLDLYLCF